MNAGMSESHGYKAQKVSNNWTILNLSQKT